METLAIKDRPILMSAPMVRVTLNTAPDTVPPVAINPALPFKWQTRRVVKPQPTDIRLSPLVPSGIENVHGYEIKIPWQVGQRLWVREAFARFNHGGIAYAGGEDGCERYAINYNDPNGRVAYRATDGEKEGLRLLKWSPSIHMPRWVSRITLEITRLRIERVQAISEEDAMAEGLRHMLENGWLLPIRQFPTLWDSINGKREDGIYSWERNPFVWVIDFKRVTP